jgi:hypothetical protein
MAYLPFCIMKIPQFKKYYSFKGLFYSMDSQNAGIGKNIVLKSLFQLNPTKFGTYINFVKECLNDKGKNEL